MTYHLWYNEGAAGRKRATRGNEGRHLCLSAQDVVVPVTHFNHEAGDNGMPSKALYVGTCEKIRIVVDSRGDLTDKPAILQAVKERAGFEPSSTLAVYAHALSAKDASEMMRTKKAPARPEPGSQAVQDEQSLRYFFQVAFAGHDAARVGAFVREQPELLEAPHPKSGLKIEEALTRRDEEKRAKLSKLQKGFTKGSERARQAKRKEAAKVKRQIQRNTRVQAAILMARCTVQK